MCRKSLRPMAAFSIAAAAILALVSLGLAETVSALKVSTFAPAKYLNDQVDYFLKRIGQDLADQTTYGEDQQGRVAKDASTLAALSLALGKHDEQHPRKQAAPQMVEAAVALADSADDFEAAAEALQQLRKALDSKSEQTLEWEPVANLTLLMQQVPIINNSLRRGVTGRRFKRQTERTAGFAATLAAIAQASLPDTDYCEDEEAQQKWQAICRDMRDASGEVLQAVRNKDQAAAKRGLDRIVMTCDACHHEFRD